MLDEAERQFWLERRRALLMEVRAIEQRWQTGTVTVTVERSEAERAKALFARDAREHYDRRVSK